MLERRLDDRTHDRSCVRETVERIFRVRDARPQSIHHNLIRLADRGPAVAIVTTNFDRLLDVAYQDRLSRRGTHSLGTIPRPRPQPEFAGVFHIHGVLSEDEDQASELVLTEQDFADFYVRRTVVPDFIYDAARIFCLVLVGYSANDPPMQTLLNAVAADSTRFEDIRPRYAFLDTDDHDRVALEDWNARGIEPIPYDPANDHAALHETIERWATLSVITGDQSTVDAEVQRLVATAWADSGTSHRDLFEHLFRRESKREQQRLSRVASDAGADLGWLNAIARVCSEKRSEQGP
ncbi:SIR2 family protein [Candidatus Palauibacter sp.]|uniref:SIR2 family protein n=1 Tax=Candidatus Palauibacter sp. TaxID=3101350 RepID=UPI003B018593